MIGKLTRREKKIFIVTMVLAVGFFIYSGPLKPFQNRLSNVDKQIEYEIKMFKKNTRKIKNAASLSQNYNYYLEAYKQELSNEQMMSSIISQIEGVANTLDLRIADLKPKPVKHDKLLNRFSVSLTIDSGFVEVMELIHTLQGNPYRLDLEEIRLEKSSRRNAKTIKSRLVLSKVLINEENK